MTDRIRSLTVVLEQDTREDDCEQIKSALLMVKGVAEVMDGPAVSSQDRTNRHLARSDLAETVWALMYLSLRHEQEYTRLQNEIKQVRAKLHRDGSSGEL